MLVLAWILGTLLWCALVVVFTAKNSPIDRLIDRYIDRA